MSAQQNEKLASIGFLSAMNAKDSKLNPSIAELYLH
jgi:hypothetical protein